MLNLNITGKTGNDAVNFLRESLGDENEIRVLIEPPQFVEIKKFLESMNFSNIMPEDDEGNLFVTAARKSELVEEPAKTEEEPAVPESAAPSIKPKIEIVKNSTGVLISCESSKYKSIFMRKFFMSLVNSKIKPDVLALMNGAVKFAAYDSKTCECLKSLENDGVKILISDSCAERMGIKEAVGAGIMVDMADILEEIFVCEKVINL